MPIPEQETLSIVRAADKRMRETEARYNEGTEHIEKADEWEAQTNQTAMGFVKQRNHIKKENQKVDRRKEDEARRLGDEVTRRVREVERHESEVARRVREVERREDEVERGDFEEPKRGMQPGGGDPTPRKMIQCLRHSIKLPNPTALNYLLHSHTRQP
jgi:hypothetical protein